MKLVRSLIIIILLVVVSACQFSPKEEGEMREGQQEIETDSEDKVNTKTAELDQDENLSLEEPASEEGENTQSEADDKPKEPEEKVISLGVEGYKEDVTLRKFMNNWLSIWVDSSLQWEENNDMLSFRKADEGVSFSIMHITQGSIEQAYKEVEQELLDSNYEFINDFQLEDRNGKGYIYYNYEERISVDVYLLQEENKEALVQFVLPEEVMETFIYRFEYMVDSIQLL